MLVPLLLVLGLPAAAQWRAAGRGDRLLLEWPMLLGYLLVLVMGVGNYIGTRRTAAALLYGIALVLAILPLAREAIGLSFHEELCRWWATAMLACGLMLGSAPRRGVARPGYDRLWLDFRDTFGIVWAKRVADRMNDAGRAQGWPVRLEMHGLAWREGAISEDERRQALAALDHTLRWLLKRFVTPEWIEIRLGASGDPKVS